MFDVILIAWDICIQISPDDLDISGRDSSSESDGASSLLPSLLTWPEELTQPGELQKPGLQLNADSAQK